MSSKLFFKKDGSFRILMVSDIQEALGGDPRSPVCYRKLVARTSPDLIIWGGDNIDGRKMKTADELRAYLDIFAAVNEDAGIPWMHIYGNHDYDMDITPLEQSAIYAEYPHCISGLSPEGVPGVSNYMIPVYDPADGKPAYAIYAFDSMHKKPVLRPGVSFESMQLPEMRNEFRKWEPLKFEQLMWYWNTSKALENEVGKTVRAMAVMHVPLHESCLVCDNPAECETSGNYDQKMQSGILNSGFFATALERGDVECIAAGHLHKDDFDGKYCGIHLCLDACAGFLPGGIDERRGGRVFDIGLDGSFATEMITYASFLSEDEMRGNG